MPEFIQFPQGIVIVHITTGCTSRSMAMAEKWNSSHIFLSSIYCAMDFKVVTCFLCSLILLLRASSLRTYDRSAFCIEQCVYVFSIQHYFDTNCSAKCSKMIQFLWTRSNKSPEKNTTNPTTGNGEHGTLYFSAK